MQNCTYTAQGFLACPNINVKKVNRTDRVYSEEFEHFTVAPITTGIQRVPPPDVKTFNYPDASAIPSSVGIKSPAPPLIVAKNNIPEKQYVLDDLSSKDKIPNITTKTITKNPSIKVTPEKPINPGA